MSYNGKKAQKLKHATIIQEDMRCIEIEATSNRYEIIIQKNTFTKCPCIECPFIITYLQRMGDVKKLIRDNI